MELDKQAKRTILIFIIAVAAIIAIGYLVGRRFNTLMGELSKYQDNTETLLSNVEFYKTKDSLNAARVQDLELTIEEFRRFRAEDADLIKSLQKKNRDLAAVNRTQSQTIISLSSVPRDTIIITKDSLIISAVKVHCGDSWYDFDGILTKDVFTGTLENRDSLIVAETIKYKRFLGFLWKTKFIKDRQIDVVNRNPHTSITDVEYITISN